MEKENRNAFELIAEINKKMKRLGYSKEWTKEVINDMTSGDYEHLVAVYNKHK